jgi:hypothetical protein
VIAVGTRVKIIRHPSLDGVTGTVTNFQGGGFEFDYKVKFEEGPQKVLGGLYGSAIFSESNLEVTK